MFKAHPVTAQAEQSRLLTSSFIRHLRARGLSDTTIKRYALSLRQFNEFAQAMNLPETLTREHIEYFLNERRQGHSDSTVRNDFVALSSYSGWLLEEGEITSNPMERMTTPRVAEHIPNPYRDDEIKAMLKACRGRTFEDSRAAAIVLVLYDTGLRGGELTRLTVEDVNLASEHIVVKGKGKRERLVRLGYKAQQAVDRYLRARARKNGHASALWLSRDSKPLTVNGVYQIIERVCRKAGVAHPGLHRFRHTAATKMADLGLGESDLMALLGWSTQTMAARYTRTGARERALKAHRKFSPGDNLQL